jgi:hypothetical protein
MEEAGGGESNLRTRLNFQPVMDNAKAHEIFGWTRHHKGKRTIQPTWRGMCCIMLRLQGIAPTRHNIRTYQAEQLGRTHGNTLLTELMPIPKPKVGHWPYGELMPQFASREAYYAAVKPQRIKLLRELVDTHQPKVVIGYGKGFWSSYKAVFAPMTFARQGQFDVGTGGKTLVILTHHFTARTMNGKFADVASIIKNRGVL